MEVVVVNAKSSTDDTCKIVLDKGVKLIQSDANSRAQQMNLGAQNSISTYLCFLHADVIPPKSFLKDIYEALELSDFGWFCYNFDSDSKMLKVNARFTRSNGFFAGGGDQILFIKRDVFDSLNGFNEDYRIMEDFELVRRLKKMFKGPTIIQNPATVSSRKYLNSSFFKVNWYNLKMMTVFMLGRNPSYLKSKYENGLAD